MSYIFGILYLYEIKLIEIREYLGVKESFCYVYLIGFRLIGKFVNLLKKVLNVRVEIKMFFVWDFYLIGILNNFKLFLESFFFF